MAGKMTDIEESYPEIAVARSPRPADLFKDMLPTAEVTPVQGRYKNAGRDIFDERLYHYQWRGWDDELQEVQEDKGD